MPFNTATILTGIGVLLMVHIVSTYSALARIIMDNGTMSSFRVLDQEVEEEMLSTELGEELLRKTIQARKAAIPVNQMYTGIRVRASKRALLRGQKFRVSSEDVNLAFEEMADVDFAD